MGTNKKQASVRTSKNAFDYTSTNSMAIKQRSFDLLGIDTFDSRLADGVQIVRYEPGEAYIAHHDYFPLNEPPPIAHNCDPQRAGTNRFATIFLYLSDVEAGGQTVFPLSDTNVSGRTNMSTNSSFLSTVGIDAGSWERDMVDTCYSATGLAVEPKKGDAILFYSQTAWGELDSRSLHGGCPVLKGVKWAANLWVWNGPKWGQRGAPKPDMGSTIESVKVQLRVENFLQKSVQLYWVNLKSGGSEHKQADLQPKAAVLIETFAGHKFRARAAHENGTVWIVGEYTADSRATQKFDVMPR
jgi:prolyl 4-hydroxylase